LWRGEQNCCPTN